MKRLFIICLVLLLCASATATKIADADDSTAIAAVKVDTEALIVLTGDVLATNKVAGDVFYVDSNAGGSASGLSWTNAVLTIEAGLTLCTAGAGDWIMVSPIHAETATTGTADLDKTDVTVWGLGNGTRMATISYDTATDTFVIGATGDGTKVHGIKFIATVTAVANAVIVEAGCTDFVIENCVFENETTTTDEFIDAILVSGTASDRGIIRNNRFLGDVGANAGPKSSINFVDCDYLQITGNEFSGDIGDAHIFNETTASNFITIKDNRIMCGFIGDAQTTLDVTPGISLVATTTGWIQDNFIVTNVATPDLSIVAADCYLSGNTYNELQGAAFAASPIGLIAGQTYVVQIAGVSVGDENLFLVAGGEILITNLIGEVTTVFDTSAATSKISINATDAGLDYDFSTAVDLTDAVDGGRFIFSAAQPSVLTPLALGAVGSGSLMSPWYCVPGVIEVIDSDDNDSTGATTWTMTFIPLTNGVTVTPQ